MHPGGPLAATGRAVRFAAGMTLGFVAVFGLVGAVLAPLAGSFERYLPVVTIVMGVLLVALGCWLLAGRSLGIPRLAGRGSAPTAAWWSQVGYGVSFALASLSCTIAPFLAVTAGAVTGIRRLRRGHRVHRLRARDGHRGARAWRWPSPPHGSWLVGAMRRAGAVISRASGALLVIAGAYVAWYGWFELRVLAGDLAGDPVVSAAVGVQEAIVAAVTEIGVGGLLVATAVLAVVLLGALLARRAVSRSSGSRAE